MGIRCSTGVPLSLPKKLMLPRSGSIFLLLITRKNCCKQCIRFAVLRVARIKNPRYREKNWKDPYKANGFEG